MVEELYSGEKPKDWVRNSAETISDFLMKDPLKELLRGKAEGKEVLDAGCGEGYVTRDLGEVAEKVVGIDSSEEMIDLARAQSEKSNEEYKVLDIREVDQMEGKFDIVVMSAVLNYFTSEELPAVFERLRKVVTRGGEIIIAGGNPYTIARRKSSKWLKHEHVSDIEEDDFLELDIRSGDEYIDGGFYFWGLGRLFDAALENGFSIKEFRDMNPTPELLEEHPSLEREKYMFFLLFLEGV